MVTVHWVKGIDGRKAISCQPHKQEALVIFMEKFGRASETWERVNCEHCITKGRSGNGSDHPLIFMHG